VLMSVYLRECVFERGFSSFFFFVLGNGLWNPFSLFLFFLFFYKTDCGIRLGFLFFFLGNGLCNPFPF